MTHADEPRHANDGATEAPLDEVVHVPAAAAELAEAVQHRRDESFVAEIPDWDQEDPLS
jgi:hypothetical protein